MINQSSKLSSQSSNIQRHFFLSSLSNCLLIVVLLVGFSPIVFSSPTPSSSSSSASFFNRYSYDSNDDLSTLTDDLSPSTVQDSLVQSSPYWYIQPRTRANDFLFSNMDENEMHLVKSDDDDDDDEQVPSPMILSNKRSVVFKHHGGFTTLKKRKHLNKAPMEVMNEIVNSIYLKR